MAEGRGTHPEPKGSHTVSVGTYETRTGHRRRYRCHPLTGDTHTFSVVLTYTGRPARTDDPPVLQTNGIFEVEDYQQLSFP